MKKIAFVLLFATLAGCAGMKNQTSRTSKAPSKSRAGNPLCVTMGDTGCAGAIGPAGTPGTAGERGAVGPRGITVPAVVVSPPVIRPGAVAQLQATVGDTAGKAYIYKWHAAEGVIGAADTNPSTWTAPDAVGSYIVGVDMNDGNETVKGFGTITVAVIPVGPIIVAVSPAESKVGGELTVTGVGFGVAQGKSRLNIGGVDAVKVISWNDTAVRALIPAGAITGPIKATVSGIDSSLGQVVILWDSENPENRVISTGTHEHVAPEIVSDGGDGALVVWQDNHAEGSGNNIYAQRVNSLGASMWDPTGVVISSAAGNQEAPQIIADGAGGAIVVWEDARTGLGYNIYAQRVNAKGERLWNEKGVAIATSANDQIAARLISDGAAGAIIVWQDFRTGAPHPYVQRVGADGKTLWTENGVAVSTAANGQTDAEIVSDAAGGVIVVWQDFRTGKHNDIYAQRIGGDGKAQWAENGVALSTAASDQIHPALAGDGAGGAIVAWEDLSGGVSHLHARRIGGDGKPQWAENGVDVSAPGQMQMAEMGLPGHPMKAAMMDGPKGQTVPQVISDGLGGAVIAWQDARSGGNDVYAQRMNGLGKVQWTTNGIAVAYAPGAQGVPQIIADGTGGVVVAWDDGRNGDQGDVYAQRINNAGRGAWTDNGAAVSTANATQSSPRMIADGTGGAIFAWQDSRAGKSNIYIQKVSASGLQ